MKLIGNDQFTSLGLLWLRLLMGTGIAYHGYGKIFSGNVERLAQGVANLGLPGPTALAWTAALSEFVGGILIAIGLKTRIAAFFVFCTMTVAVFLHHKADPLRVKELALAYWTIAGALMLMGPGKYSLDRS